MLLQKMILKSLQKTILLKKKQKFIIKYIFFQILLNLKQMSFQKNREIFTVPQKDKNVDKLAEKMHGSLKEFNEFKSVPQCHLLLMIKRFFKFRMCFWSDFMNTQIVEKKKAQIKKDAAIKRSSKSMTGFHL